MVCYLLLTFLSTIELNCNFYISFLGTGVMIISPTRELAMQTFGVLKELMKYHHYTYGLVMGGASRQTEAQKLSKGSISFLFRRKF